LLKMTKLALQSKLVKLFLPHRSVFKVRLPLLTTLTILQVIDTVVNHFFNSFPLPSAATFITLTHPQIECNSFGKSFSEKVSCHVMAWL
ncbi:hypothetical protein, partial [Exiguobacterium sp. s142]|uniref:hypothetical protein n=1 Tax=Exiguobacterium sp. s142 TaxID=2751222 RepID=UPI001BE5B404